MLVKIFLSMTMLMPLALGQPADKGGQSAPPGSSPVYSVTVVERTVKAVNYQYRSDPTPIDFRATVLLPKAKGEAWVESKQGRTLVDAKFENVPLPIRFGSEYLTYVLWALTPDGHPYNLAEVIPDGGDKAKLHVTTDLQAFALIVTAEPYSAVRRPSDVVVLENVVRKDTMGKIEQVDAKYELLPRGQFSWRVPDSTDGLPQGAPKVSMRQYEALSELYQAQNAVALALSAHADQYAASTMQKAQMLLKDAQQLQDRKAEPRRVVQDAREAAQAAEDARIIAEQHQQHSQVEQAQADTAVAVRARAEAEAELQQLRAITQAAQAQSAQAQAQADADRAARERAQADADRTREIQAAPAPLRTASQMPPGAPQGSTSFSSVPPPTDARKLETRRQLLGQLAALDARDTPRGIVVTIADADFDGSQLRVAPLQHIYRLSSTVASYPALRMDVESHSDTEANSSAAFERANQVRVALTATGGRSNFVSVRNLGNSRPLGPNTTESARQQNRRIEIVITGDAIGSVPVWDRTYSLMRR